MNMKNLLLFKQFISSSDLFTCTDVVFCFVDCASCFIRENKPLRIYIVTFWKPTIDSITQRTQEFVAFVFVAHMVPPIAGEFHIPISLANNNVHKISREKAE